jgi:hypothetical protein
MAQINFTQEEAIILNITSKVSEWRKVKPEDKPKYKQLNGEIFAKYVKKEMELNGTEQGPASAFVVSEMKRQFSEEDVSQIGTPMKELNNPTDPITQVSLTQLRDTNVEDESDEEETVKY